MKRALSLLALLVLVAACQDQPPATPNEQAAAVDGYDSYGGALTPDDAVPVQTAVAESAAYVGQAVKLEGTVHSVCQMAGCWLALDAGDGQTVRVMVEHKEDGGYEFTVPTDISGRRVVVAGTLEEKEVSADEQRHYAEDAGETLPDDVQPKQMLQMTASGVLVAKS